MTGSFDPGVMIGIRRSGLTERLDARARLRRAGDVTDPIDEHRFDEGDVDDVVVVDAERKANGERRRRPRRLQQDLHPTDRRTAPAAR